MCDYLQGGGNPKERHEREDHEDGYDGRFFVWGKHVDKMSERGPPDAHTPHREGCTRRNVQKFDDQRKIIGRTHLTCSISCTFLSCCTLLSFFFFLYVCFFLRVCCVCFCVYAHFLAIAINKFDSASICLHHFRHTHNPHLPFPPDPYIF